MARIELRFTEDVFGPARALNQFAAIGLLPDEFCLRRKDGGAEWILTVLVHPEPRINRVLSRICSLPGVLSMGGVDGVNGTDGVK